MIREYREIHSAGWTFAPSFTAFLIQSIETMVLDVREYQRKNPGGHLMRYAGALLRKGGVNLFGVKPQRRPLSRRRKKRRVLLGETEDTTIPRELVRQLDAIFRPGPKDRSGTIRLCLARGLKRARETAPLWKQAGGHK
jgi:hypothetical protein